jgi:hypothetical protein
MASVKVDQFRAQFKQSWNGNFVESEINLLVGMFRSLTTDERFEALADPSTFANSSFGGDVDELQLQAAIAKVLEEGTGGGSSAGCNTIYSTYDGGRRVDIQACLRDGFEPH